MNFDQAEFDRNADILSKLGVVGFTRDNDGTLGGRTPQQVKRLRYEVAQADQTTYVTACDTLREWLSGLAVQRNRTLYGPVPLLQDFISSYLVTNEIIDLWVFLDCPNPDDVQGLPHGRQEGSDEEYTPRTWRKALVDSLVALAEFCIDGQLSEGFVTETKYLFQQAVDSAKVYRDWIYGDLLHHNRVYHSAGTLHSAPRSVASDYVHPTRRRSPPPGMHAQGHQGRHPQQEFWPVSRSG